MKILSYTIAAAYTKINFALICLLSVTLLVATTSCSEDDDSDPDGESDPVKIEFRETTKSVAENNTVGTRLLIDLEGPAPESGTFTVNIESPDGAVYGEDFTTTPQASEGKITVNVTADSTFTSIQFLPVNNTKLEGDKTVKFTLADPTGGITLGENITAEVQIKEDEDMVMFSYTSFEEPSTMLNTLYIDVNGSPLEDHDLINNPDEPPVDYISTGGEIGFDATYINTRDSSGLTNGTYVGVTKATVVVGAFTESVQGYEMSNTDGMMRLTFDQVDISEYFSTNVEVDLFLHDLHDDGIEYEYNDYIKLYIKVDGGEEIEILNSKAAEGDRIDSTYPNLLNQWNTVVGVIPGSHTTATLIIEADFNSINEIMYIDNVRFLGINSDG